MLQHHTSFQEYNENSCDLSTKDVIISRNAPELLHRLNCEVGMTEDDMSTLMVRQRSVHAAHEECVCLSKRRASTCTTDFGTYICRDEIAYIMQCERGGTLVQRPLLDLSKSVLFTERSL